MRQVLFDTETTGLDPKKDRIVSIAGVMLEDGAPNGDFFHFYLNPEQPCDPKATEIHGLTDEFLAAQPKFADVWAKIEDFLTGVQLIIHNAQFDLGFVAAEVARMKLNAKKPVATCTLTKARALRGSGGKGFNTLDALARVYKVENLRAKTGKHGALVDCLVLLGVYRALFGLPPRPLVDSEIEHYLSLNPGIYYYDVGSFARLRERSPDVPARPKTQDVPAEVRDGGEGTGEDLLRSIEIPDAPDAGQPEPVQPADGDRPGGGRSGGIDCLLAAVRRGGA